MEHPNESFQEFLKNRRERRLVLFFIGLLVCAGLLIANLCFGAEPEFCVGDCDGNCQVTVDELIVGVNIALDIKPIEHCWNVNRNRDAEVTVDELVAAVLNDLNGCPKVACPDNTMTPTERNTETATIPPTGTATLRSTETPTMKSTETATATITETASRTATLVFTNTATETVTRTPTETNTPDPTSTASNTVTATNTATNTVTPLDTATKTFTNTATQTFTATETKTYTPTRTDTPTRTPTLDGSTVVCEFFESDVHKCGLMPRWKCEAYQHHMICADGQVCGEDNCCHDMTPTPTITDTYTKTFTNTPTNTSTVTATVTQTVTNTVTNTPTYTFTQTKTVTKTFTPTRTNTVTKTMTATAVFTNTATDTPTEISTNTATETNVPTDTVTKTQTPTRTATITRTFTGTATFTTVPTDTQTPTYTFTQTKMVTKTFTPTATWTSTKTQTFTPTATETPIPFSLMLIQLSSCQSITGTETPFTCNGFGGTVGNFFDPAVDFTFNQNDEPRFLANFWLSAPAGNIQFRWEARDPANNLVDGSPFTTDPITFGNGSFPIDTWFLLNGFIPGTYQIKLFASLEGGPFNLFVVIQVAFVGQTPTPTNTATVTVTKTATGTKTSTNTSTVTATYTNSPQPTNTQTRTVTRTVTNTATFVPTNTETVLPPSTSTRTSTQTKTVTSTFSASPSASPTPTTTPIYRSYKVVNLGFVGRDQSASAAHTLVDEIKNSGATTVQCYGAEYGCENVYCYAKSKSLTTVANLYVTGDSANDTRELQAFQAIESCVDYVTVGSNLITYGMSVTQWTSLFDQVDALTTKPVGIAEMKGTLLNASIKAALLPKIKYIWLDNLTFFDAMVNNPDDAVNNAESDYTAVASAYAPNISILGGEYGYPTSASPMDARATIANAKAYHCKILGSSIIPLNAIGLYSWIDEPGLTYNQFLPYFGLLDSTNTNKFTYPFLCQ